MALVMATQEHLVSGDGCLVSPSWPRRPRESLALSLAGGLKKLGSIVSGGWQPQGRCTRQARTRGRQAKEQFFLLTSRSGLSPEDAAHSGEGLACPPTLQLPHSTTQRCVS